MPPHIIVKAAEDYFEVFTVSEKIIADYAKISLLDVEELDVFSFYGLLHDAIIWNYRQTEDGQKKLKQAWRLNQTKPEKAKLREKGMKKIG